MPYACPIKGEPVALKLNSANSRNDDTSADAINDSQPKKFYLQSDTASEDEDDEDDGCNQLTATTTGSSQESPALRPAPVIAKGSNNSSQASSCSSNPADINSSSSSISNSNALPINSTPSSSANTAFKSPSPSPASAVKRANSKRTNNIIIDSKVSKLSLGLAEMLKFPRESTHAYSYAQLAPNSLAVRLTTLKRSLEILMERPDLLNEDHPKHSSPLNINIEHFINEIHNESTANGSNNIKFQANASSAALSALFNANNTNNNTNNNDTNENNEIKPMGLKALIDILQGSHISKSQNGTTKNQIARNLHDLSLSNFNESVGNPLANITNNKNDNNNQTNDNNVNIPDEETDLKIKLLHALATPFYESIVQIPIISNIHKGASTLALSSLSNQENNGSNSKDNRFFHNVSQRNTSPQAVFTSELSSPWDLKAANDLACLIFGVSRNSLKRLTLLDLISPDSRPFVLKRLAHCVNNTSQEIIFSGEIVAIAKPGNKLTWASLWAKKKGNLIICMFDQVPCDCVDLVINTKSLNIISSKKITGNFIFNDVPHLSSINQLVYKIDKFISNEPNNNTSLSMVERSSNIIDKQRYFTLLRDGFHLPCAISTHVIDEDESLLKLKIHSMPYIAGVFIISNKRPFYNILSFNSSVAKNLFGLHDSDLTNKPITDIIPNFNKIMNLISKLYTNLQLNKPGLVLPEHFFRQMNTLIEQKTEKDFLNSIGLDAKHKDGSIIKIDVQLRCSNSDTMILWITHSRAVFEESLSTYKASKFSNANLEKIINTTFSSNSSRNHSRQISRSSDIDDNITGNDINITQEEDQEEDLPSQLSILNENEIKSISRSSSLRSNANSNSTLSSLRMTSSTDINNENNFKSLSKNVSEEELLKVENQTIENSKNSSEFYPKAIGLRRRDKKFTEFNILKKMGQGAYGNVVYAEYVKDPEKYKVVIKMIIKERILVDTWVRDRKLGTVPSEIQIMATLNNTPHPNIMRLIDFFEDDDYYYIEIPQHGFPTPAIDLFDLIEFKKNIGESESKSIIRQCVSALNHLHKRGIVHRDIKDENVIIDEKGIIKLIDFGSAAYVKSGLFDVFVGTLDYAAPEVLNGQPYEGKPQDVWSLGILIYTLIYKENPFYNVDEIMEGELRIPFIPSENCIHLIKKILQRDIALRPSMEEIAAHPWFLTD